MLSCRWCGQESWCLGGSFWLLLGCAYAPMLTATGEMEQEQCGGLLKHSSPMNQADMGRIWRGGWNLNGSMLSTWAWDFSDSDLLFSCNLDFNRPLLNGLVLGLLRLFPGGTTPDPGMWWVHIWTDSARGLRSLQERCYVGEGCSKGMQPSALFLPASREPLRKLAARASSFNVSFGETSSFLATFPDAPQ